MVSKETNSLITNLALIGGGGFLLFKSGILDGLKGFGAGVGQAGSGLGEGISDFARGAGSGLGNVGREVGDFAGNVSGFFDPFGAIGETTANKIRENADFDSLVNAATSDERVQGAEERERIRQQETTNRTKIFQENFTQGVDRLAKLDDRVLSFGKSVVGKIKQFAEIGSVVSFNPFTTSALSGAVSKALVDSSAGTQGRTLDTKQEPNISVAPTQSRSLKSSGSNQTLAPTPRESALKQSLPASTRNLPAQTIAPTKSLRSKIVSFFKSGLN